MKKNKLKNKVFSPEEILHAEKKIIKSKIKRAERKTPYPFGFEYSKEKK
tara:strand:- start:3723 stop:3869 length:147 start_codon:yes stop_codon:yes gene_type:complete